jgi:hypothetical protein
MKKQSKAQAIIEDLHNKVEAFEDSDQLKNYLDFSSRFINRSMNNQFLIFFSNPHATYVKGYKQWIDDHKRIVVACTVCRSFKNVECTCEERTAPKRIEQLAPMTKKTGEIIKVNGKDTEEEILFFRVVFVFDVADTEALEGGEEIPSLVDWVTGETDEEITQRFIKIVEDNGFNFRYDSWSSKDLNGWTDFTNKEVVVSSDRPEAQQLKTIIHEIGHMFAHAEDREFNMTDPRPLREVEAESIAYTVANMLGLDTSSYSVGYVAGWSSNDKETLHQSMKAVLKTVQLIMDKM